MQKKLVILFTIVVCIGAIMWFFGLFPIARINGDYMLYRTYGNRVNALEMFEEKSKKSSEGGAFTPADAERIQQRVLQDLVTEKIFRQYIQDHSSLAGVEDEASTAVQGTLAVADPDILPRATKELYGWSVNEFMKEVLFPQALQNKLREHIERDGAEFEEFVRTQLRNANVRFYTVPWKWENGEVIKK